MSNTPALDKMLGVVASTQPAGEFLDWLRNVKNVTLVKWGEWQETSICSNWGCDGGKVRGKECPKCGGTGVVHFQTEGWSPIAMSTEQLLAEWQGIDLAQVDSERRAMLEQLRGEVES